MNFDDDLVSLVEEEEALSSLISVAIEIAPEDAVPSIAPVEPGETAFDAFEPNEVVPAVAMDPVDEFDAFEPGEMFQISKIPLKRMRSMRSNVLRCSA